MSEKPSASVFKVKKLTGEWWIPGSAHRCHGTLTFDIGGDQQLKIIGFLEGKYTGKIKNYKVLYGLCTQNNETCCVTIFNAGYMYIPKVPLHEYDICENTIDLGNVWIGNRHYNDQDDVKFSSFSFGIHNLEQWQAEINAFSIAHINTTTVTTTMTLPPVIKLFEDTNVTIEIKYTYKVPDCRIGQLEAVMNYHPVVKIKSKNGMLPFYGEDISFDHYWYSVYEFFEILLDGYTYFYDLKGFGEIPDDLTVQTKAELVYSRPINTKQRKNISCSQVMMPYKKVQNCLFDTFSGFMSRQKEMSDILENLFIFTTTNTYHVNPLPSLLFALEGLQRIFYNRFGESSSDENKADYADFENKKNAIISCCSEDLHSFIKQKLSWQVPFQKRLYRMIKEYSAVFTSISDDVCEKLSKELKDIRNQSAHCDNREDTSWGVIFNLTRFVEYLHYAIILHNCGMPQETIKNCFEGCHPYNFNDIMKFISTRYAAKEETK